MTLALTRTSWKSSGPPNLGGPFCLDYLVAESWIHTNVVISAPVRPRCIFYTIHRLPPYRGRGRCAPEMKAFPRSGRPRKKKSLEHTCWSAKCRERERSSRQVALMSSYDVKKTWCQKGLMPRGLVAKATATATAAFVSDGQRQSFGTAMRENKQPCPRNTFNGQ